MTSTSRRTLIEAAPEVVFDYVADVRRQREWNRAVSSMEQVTPGPIGVGTRFAGQIKRVGEVTVDTVEFDRPMRVVHHAHPSIAEVRHEWRFRGAGGGTILEQRAVMRPKGRGWLVSPLVPLIVRLNTRDCAVSLRRELSGKR